METRYSTDESAPADPTPVDKIWARINDLEAMASGLEEFAARFAGSRPTPGGVSHPKPVANGLLEELNERLAFLADRVATSMRRLQSTGVR